MNLYIKKLSFLLLSLAFVFTACETEESIEITSPEPALVLQQPGISNVFLNFGIPDNPALTMSWNDNLTSSSSYDVEMALDADFTSTVNLGNVSSKSLSISVEELNNSIRDAGATSYVDIAIYVRVDAGEAISNSVQYLVTTYPTEAPVISSPSENDEFILSIGSLDEVAMTIDWTDAVLSSDLGIDVNYVIQAAAIETDFEAPVTIGTSTNGTSITSTHSELNAIAIGIGLTPDVSGAMEIRIIGKNTNANGNVLERISDVVTVSVTSFSVSFPYLYQVGDASTAGWDNNNNNTPIFRNQDIPNAYVYTGYFMAGAFKMLETKGDSFEGKKVVVIEDSVIRGTTGRSRIRSLREVGVKEVHMLISCPPTRNPCYYGIDFPSSTELVAAKKSVEEIREYLDLDTLYYLSLEGMIRATGGDPNSFCKACFDGKYPIPPDTTFNKLSFGS